MSGLDADPVLSTLVGSLVEFARGIDALVVAEGVETAAEAGALRALGVDYGQGWHFGRPAVPEPVAPTPTARAESRASILAS